MTARATTSRARASESPRRATISRLGRPWYATSKPTSRWQRSRSSPANVSTSGAPEAIWTRSRGSSHPMRLRRPSSVEVPPLATGDRSLRGAECGRREVWRAGELLLHEGHRRVQGGDFEQLVVLDLDLVLALDRRDDLDAHHGVDAEILERY